MHLHAFAHGRFFRVARIVLLRRLEQGHDRRRRRRTHAEEDFQEPLAAGDGRGSRGLRRHAQQGAFPEQPTPHVEVGAKSHAPEPAAVDVRDPVVAGEPFVDERVVRGQQIQDAAVLVDDAVEQELDLAAKRVPQVVVEIRIDAGIRLHGVQRSQVQPLTREVLDQLRRLRIGHHPTHLLLERRRLAKPSLLRKGQELIVRHAAPEEERQPGRQRQVADAIGPAGRHSRGGDLASIDEFRIREQATQRFLDAVIEGAGASARAVELHEHADVGGSHRPAEGPARQGRTIVRAHASS